MNDAPARIGMMATEAIGLLIDAVDQIPPNSWDQPSNLEDWSLRDLVGHATGSAAKIVTLVEDREVWSGPSRPADWVCEVPAARLRELADRLRDVHCSQGRLVDLPEDLLALCRGLVESVPEDMLRRPGGFGAAQPVPEDSTPTARLMAYLGRSVDGQT